MCFIAVSISTIAGIANARQLSVRVLAEPVQADDCNHHVTTENRILDTVAVVDAGRNAVDVEEDGLLAVLPDQIIADAPRHVLGVGTTV